MALTNEEILDAIASKTVLEISELIKMMEEKFGVSAAAAAVAALMPLINPKDAATSMYTKDTTVSGFRRVSLMSPKGLSSKMIMIDSK